MDVSSVDYSLPDNKNRVVKKVLGKDDFLQLLVAQLKNQNPLEPQSNEQFIAQMAQFTSLETLSSLDKNMQFAQAQSLIGKKVTLVDKQEVIDGTVEKAGFVDEKPKIFIDGQSYDLSQITVVETVAEEKPGPEPAEGLTAQLAQASQLINREVTIDADQEEPVSGVVEKVGLMDGSLKIYVGGSPYDIAQVTQVK